MPENNPANMVTIPSYSANFNASRLEELIRMDERMAIAHKMLVKDLVKDYKYVISHEEDDAPKTVESRREATLRYCICDETIKQALDVMGMSLESLVDEAMELVDGPF